MNLCEIEIYDMNLNYYHHPPAKICGNEALQLQTNDELNEKYQSNTTVTNKNREAMEVNNNTFRIWHVNKNGTIRWRCVKKTIVKQTWLLPIIIAKTYSLLKPLIITSQFKNKKKNGINNRNTITIKKKAQDDLFNKPSKLVCNEIKGKERMLNMKDIKISIFQFIDKEKERILNHYLNLLNKVCNI